MRKDVPRRNFADLVRDFRIDEEDGFDRDPKLESPDKNADKLSLMDKIAQI